MSKKIPSQDLRNERLRKDPTCSKCGKTKTINDFQKKGVDYWCRDCRKVYAIRLYHKKRANLSNEELLSLRDKTNDRQKDGRDKRMSLMSNAALKEYKDKVNLGNKERRDSVRHAVYMAYGGYKCACCGEQESKFLSIDHINNDGARHKRESNIRAGEQMYRWLIRNGFPGGFQILCMNCQWGKRNNHGICPHKSSKV